MSARITTSPVTQFGLFAIGSVRTGQLFRCLVAKQAQLAVQAGDVHLDPAELTFGDYTKLVVGWLTKNPW